MVARQRIARSTRSAQESDDDDDIDIDAREAGGGGGIEFAEPTYSLKNLGFSYAQNR
jgi:hypothetical protein